MKYEILNDEIIIEKTEDGAGVKSALRYTVGLVDSQVQVTVADFTGTILGRERLCCRQDLVLAIRKILKKATA